MRRLRSIDLTFFSNLYQRVQVKRSLRKNGPSSISSLLNLRQVARYRKSLRYRPSYRWHCRLYLLQLQGTDATDTRLFSFEPHTAAR